ncbi:MAG TPA: chemotaxis protein CheW [Ktedonobacteraceae bacterium]
MNEHSTVNATYLDETHLHNLEQLSDDEFWDYARTLAHQVPVAVQTEEYLECTLSNGSCLIPLTALNEVVLPPHRLALLPTTPEWMSGVVAWRGEVIAVIDLSMYLSGHTLDLSNGILLVAHHAGPAIGLLVPSIGQTTPIQHDVQLALPNPVEVKETEERVLSWYLPSRAIYVRGIQKESLVLDMPSLLADAVQQIETEVSDGR